MGTVLSTFSADLTYQQHIDNFINDDKCKVNADYGKKCAKLLSERIKTMDIIDYKGLDNFESAIMRILQLCPETILQIYHIFNTECYDWNVAPYCDCSIADVDGENILFKITNTSFLGKLLSDGKNINVNHRNSSGHTFATNISTELFTDILCQNQICFDKLIQRNYDFSYRIKGWDLLGNPSVLRNINNINGNVSRKIVNSLDDSLLLVYTDPSCENNGDKIANLIHILYDIDSYKLLRMLTCKNGSTTTIHYLVSNNMEKLLKELYWLYWDQFETINPELLTTEEIVKRFTNLSM